MTSATIEREGDVATEYGRIFVDMDATDDVDVGDGWQARLRRDVDYETDQRLNGALAPVTVDPADGSLRVGQADLAGAHLALLNAYLIAVIPPDGEPVDVRGKVGRIDRNLGDRIVKVIRERRRETADSLAR